MRKCGILLHPISLPSKYGIGDMGEESYKFADFLEKSGCTLWQVLPFGHTGFGDSPYQSFSTFACNPLMISPDKLYEEGLITESELKEYPVTSGEKIDYGTVTKAKNRLFELAASRFNFKSRKYTAWYKKNAFWLDDYALFLAAKNYFIKERDGKLPGEDFKAFSASEPSLSEDMAKDCYYGGSWNSFPEGLRDRDPKEIKKYTSLLKKEINVYKFTQYEFYIQWTALKEYANEKGIKIIGDIPIFVALDSSDTWSNRELFDINTKGWPNTVAGVPPDYFSVKGQLWGNPLYNWKKMKEDGYDWWTKRLSALAPLADIVRIDHFRGFDSYYSIPFSHTDATKGKWKKGPGAQFFNTVLSKTNTEIIAEDLGDITDSVIKLRDKLGFPGMKILQFAFGSDSANSYLPFNYTSDNFTVYTGTHDNDTTVGWYNSTDEKTKDRFRRTLNSSGEDVAWDLIRYAISSSAKYAVIPLQDVLRLDARARMNTPGTSSGNWQFRFKEGALTDKLAEDLLYLNRLFNRV